MDGPKVRVYILVYLHCADSQHLTADRVLAINTEMGYIATMMSPLASAAGSGTMSFLQSGSNAIVDGLPELLKVLQDVAAIHPFIARKSYILLFRYKMVTSTRLQWP